MKILLHPIISCLVSISQPITPEVIQDYKECKKIEFQVESVSSWQPLINKYFRHEDYIEVSRIIYCESRGKATAVGTNKDGSKDIGLMQLNDRTYNWISDKLDWEGDRTDPEFNLKMSSWLYYKSGNHHWNPSRFCWEGEHEEN